jgi:hypothetical protein
MRRRTHRRYPHYIGPLLAMHLVLLSFSRGELRTDLRRARGLPPLVDRFSIYILRVFAARNEREQGCLRINEPAINSVPTLAHLYPSASFSTSTMLILSAPPLPAIRLICQTVTWLRDFDRR